MIPFLRSSFEWVFAMASLVIFFAFPRFFFVSSILVPWVNYYLLKRFSPVFRPLVKTAIKQRGEYCLKRFLSSHPSYLPYLFPFSNPSFQENKDG